MALRQNLFKSWLRFYWVYLIINIAYLIWTIYEPTTIKVITTIIMIGLFIFNTTKIKKMRDMANREMKEEILEQLK